MLKGVVSKHFPVRGGEGSPRMTTLPSLLLPAGLLTLAVLVLNLPWVPEASVEGFLRVFRWVVLGLGVLLGVRFRRGRVVFALLALALADWALRTYPRTPAPGDAGRFAFAAAAFLLPANLGWLALARERGTLTGSGFVRFTVILTQFGLAGLLWMLFDRGLTALLERQIFPTLLVPTTVLPHPALAAFAFAFVATAVSWARRRTYIESGFFWAAAASYLALAAGGRGTTAYLATAGLIMVVALVEATFAMAYRDGLTGLPGRRAFEEALTTLSGRYAIAMVDIDYFKKVNDDYGHDVGDQVLRFIATRVAGTDGARAFRFGGEEFALIFPNTSRGEALSALEEKRREIANDPFALRGDDRPKKRPKRVEPRSVGPQRLTIKVSAGVAEQGGRLLKPEEVLRAADEALYRAKRAGRNRVCT
jgi:diguanylate cyclase (GGDEF)-like protein